MLTPSIIGQNHDRFIQRYLDTAKNKAIENQLQQFAVAKNGYLIQIELLIKVFPQLSGRITFVGLIQRGQDFQAMPQPKEALQNYPYHYLMTDHKGNIANMTEGLAQEIGLHAQFFKFNDQSINSMISIQLINQNILDEDVEESLDSGSILTIDTGDILQYVELEKLNADDIQQIRSNQGRFQAFVQMKKVVLDQEFCKYNLYRFIIIEKSSSYNGQSGHKANSNKFILEDLNQAKQLTNQDPGTPLIESEAQNFNSQESNGSSVILSISGQSGSSSSSAQSMETLIKDFKNKLNERRTPKTLIILNRMIIFILLCIIILTSIDFHTLRSDIEGIGAENEHNLGSERRTLSIVELSLNVRSYINIANKLEFEQWELNSLNALQDRFEYLGRLIQEQGDRLQEVQEYMSQHRVDGEDSGTDELQSKMEYQSIDLYRIDDQNLVSLYQQPYRVAFFTFLNGVQQLNLTSREDLLLPKDLLRIEPSRNSTYQFGNTSLIQKIAYFVQTNGLRTIRTYSREATKFQQETTFGLLSSNPFLIIMALVIAMTVVSIVSILLQMWKIEKIQLDVLSLYAILNIENVKVVYQRCVQYIHILDEGSFVKQIQIDGKENSKNNNDQTSSMQYQAVQDMDREEESKQDFEYRKPKSKKRRKVQEKGFIGEEFYSLIIKKATQEINHYQEDSKEKNIEEIKQQKDLSVHEQPKKQKTVKKTHEDSIIKKFTQSKFLNQGQKQTNLRPSQVKEADSESSTRSLVEDTKQIKRSSRHQNRDKNPNRNNVQQFHEEDNENGNEFDPKERKKQFAKTWKTQNVGVKILNILLGLIFSAYFIQVYLLHEHYKNQIEVLVKAIPIFFNRYRYHMLTYGLLRERIIYNNSLESFENDEKYGHDIDLRYYDKSIEIERQIEAYKSSQDEILTTLVQYLKDCDSPSFCTKIIGQTTKETESEISKVALSKFKVNKITAFQTQINTIIKACNAAFKGDIKSLQTLFNKGLDLNQGDYDKRTPLQFAVRGNQAEAVAFLLKQNVKVNTFDRWGASPLNYALHNSAIEDMLLQKGAVQGVKPVSNYTAWKYSLTDDQYRAYYACSSGDLQTLEMLSQIGLKFNFQDIDLRTPAHIAASDDQMDIAKFLVSKNADLLLVDSWGNNPVKDAIRENHLMLHEFLDAIMSGNIIDEYCSQFGQGIFEKGISSGLATFRKKFSDLKIMLNQTAPYPGIISLLGGKEFNEGQPFKNETFSNYTIIQTYFEAHELYLNQVLETQVQMIVDSFTSYQEVYSQRVYIVFVVFIALQGIILLFLRGRMISKMRSTIVENRGILNLIPNKIIDQNKAEVEELIKKLKD